MDFYVQTTGAGFAADLAKSKIPAGHQAVAAALCRDLVLVDGERVDVHVAISEPEAKWVVVRAAKVIGG